MKIYFKIITYLFPVTILIYLLSFSFPKGISSIINVMDDSLMFYRYGVNINKGYGISWNFNEHTYGTTSLLYLLLVTFFKLFTYDLFPVYFMRLMSILSLVLLVIYGYLIKLEDNRNTLYKYLLISTILLSNTISSNASNGMETTFSMFLIFLFYYNFLDDVLNDFQFKYITYFFGILLYIVRPDSILIEYSTLLVFFLFKKRSGILNLIIISGLFLMLTLIFSKYYFGHFFPLSFYIKKSSFIFTANFPYVIEFIKDPITIFYIGIIMVIGFYDNNYRFFSITIIFSILIHFLYLTFFTNQIMGHGARFYTPSIGALLAFIFIYIKHTRINFNYDKYLPVVLILVSIYLLSISQSNYKKYLKNSPVVKNYQELYEKLYGKENIAPKLVNLELNAKCTIAATEIGFVGVLFLNNPVYDLVGLNFKEIALSGTLNVDNFIQEFHPDIIFTPHPGYKKMIEDLITNKYFKDNYKAISSQYSKLPHGLAFYKNSECFSDFERIINESKLQFQDVEEAFPNYDSINREWIIE